MQDETQTGRSNLSSEEDQSDESVGEEDAGSDVAPEEAVHEYVFCYSSCHLSPLNMYFFHSHSLGASDNKDEDAESETVPEEVDTSVVTAAYFQDPALHKIYVHLVDHT